MWYLVGMEDWRCWTVGNGDFSLWSVFHVAVFNTVLFTGLLAHTRTMTSDPGIVPLSKNANASTRQNDKSTRAAQNHSDSDSDTPVRGSFVVVFFQSIISQCLSENLYNQTDTGIKEFLDRSRFHLQKFRELSMPIRKNLPLKPFFGY